MEIKRTKLCRPGNGIDTTTKILAKLFDYGEKNASKTKKKKKSLQISKTNQIHSEFDSVLFFAFKSHRRPGGLNQKCIVYALAASCFLSKFFFSRPKQRSTHLRICSYRHVSSPQSKSELYRTIFKT